MKKYIGKFVSLTLFVLLFALLSVVFLTACEASPRKFYTLKKAYQKNFLSKEDLQSIAKERCLDESAIKEEVLGAMKEDYVSVLNGQSDKQYTAEDVHLEGYWGEFHGFYVVQMARNDVQFTANLLEIEVGGVKIEYSGPELMVWRYN